MGLFRKGLLLVALAIGSIFLDSNLVICNKNHKTVHTLWPGNSTWGISPKKERTIGPQMLNTPFICISKDVVLCSGAGVRGRTEGSCTWVGGQEAFTGNQQFRITPPCNHRQAPGIYRNGRNDFWRPEVETESGRKREPAHLILSHYNEVVNLWGWPLFEPASPVSVFSQVAYLPTEAKGYLLLF